MTNTLVIGADIGGTHITAALVNLNKRAIVPGTLNREKVDSDALSHEIVRVWSRAITNAGKTRNVKKVGLAMPGPFDYEQGISLIKNQGKYDNLYGLNIKELLSEQLQCEPGDMGMVNDAAAFIQGEVFGGAALGYEKAIGVTLGTGLGTCIYDNHIATNANLWELPFKAGIAEDYLSTRWFVARCKEVTGNTISGVQELAIDAAINVQVQSIFQEFGENLADFLTEFLAMTTSEVIILGGNIAKSFAHFKEPLFKSVHTKYPDIAIKTALLGEEAALLGAASCCKPDQ